MRGEPPAVRSSVPSGMGTDIGAWSRKMTVTTCRSDSGAAQHPYCRRLGQVWRSPVVCTTPGYADTVNASPHCRPDVMHAEPAEWKAAAPVGTLDSVSILCNKPSSPACGAQTHSECIPLPPSSCGQRATPGSGSDLDHQREAQRQAPSPATYPCASSYARLLGAESHPWPTVWAAAAR